MISKLWDFLYLKRYLAKVRLLSN